MPDLDQIVINEHHGKDRVVVLLEPTLGRLVRRDAAAEYRKLSSQIEMIVAAHYRDELAQ